MPDRYRLIGSTASPYALKLRAILRYRRIPHDWVIMTKQLRQQTAHLKPNLIPVLQYPDGTFRGETTTLAWDLEARHKTRSIIPDDKAVAFVCDLLEDMADEWAVKPLFFYRWWDEEDQAYVRAGPARNGRRRKLRQAALRKSRNSAAARFRACRSSARQAEPAAARRELPAHPAAFEPHVGMTKYLFGSRPSLADFAWYGQLAQLATDPSPMRIMRKLAPMTDHWVRRLDDASGVANAEAFAQGRDRLEISAWGLPYVLTPFKYQVKCLERLRERFAALPVRIAPHYGRCWSRRVLGVVGRQRRFSLAAPIVSLNPALFLHL